MRKALPIVLALAFAVLSTTAFAASSEPSFKVVSSQKPAESNANELRSDVAISPTNAWAVGITRSSKANSEYHPLIEHFTGSSWTTATSPSFPADEAAFLNGVTATSASNVFAVGFVKPPETNGGAVSLIERFNGTEWTRLAQPVEEPPNSDLAGVSADAANDAWAVGDSNPTNPHESGTVTLLEHFNGTKWSVVNGAPEYPSAKYDSLSAVDAIAANDVWVAGATGTQKTTSPVLEYFNGTAWKVVPQPVHEDNARVTSISGTSSSDVWLVGNTEGGPFTEHFNGTEWTRVEPAGPSELFGVSDLGVGSVFAVGRLRQEGKPTLPAIEHFNGSSWSVVQSPAISSGSLTAVASLPAEGLVFAVGQEGEKPLTIQN